MIPIATSTPNAPQETLKGLVERVTFHEPHSGFSVLQVRVKGHRELVPILGNASVVSPGEYCTAVGQWTLDQNHGRQFRAQRLELVPPTTAAGIEKYLGSGMVKGIGPVMAKRLVDAFGTNVFTIIEEVPERLREVPGIGPHRAARIASGWQAQKAIQAIMVFLHSHGVSTAQAVRIFHPYGDEAIPTVQANPYQLARDIRGIGFKSADQIARHLGIAPSASKPECRTPSRKRREKATVGFRPTNWSARPRNSSQCRRVWSGTRLRTRSRPARSPHKPSKTPPCIFLPGLAYQERRIAAMLCALRSGRPPWPKIDADRAIAWSEAQQHLTLADRQRAAVRHALASKVFVLTGGPGVGKTTLVWTFLQIVTAKGITPALCAPTGKAAKRLAETSGRPAQTIHRLLEFKPPRGFAHDADHPLAAQLIIADESSMIDVSLMYSLLNAIPIRAALVLVGDVDQIPSVGLGQVFRDILESGAVPSIRLTEVFRQAVHSQIVQTCTVPSSTGCIYVTRA